MDAICWELTVFKGSLHRGWFTADD